MGTYVELDNGGEVIGAAHRLRADAEALRARLSCNTIGAAQATALAPVDDYVVAFNTNYIPSSEATLGNASQLAGVAMRSGDYAARSVQTLMAQDGANATGVTIV
ncbi:hypothetical protein KZZ52_42800 [Dactylosporangium sp. AC04546]|uniref:hypothetical protein n=1 Tax=Dactylosporangium sp. AC04546 TaxID=2862460 RepID=UPI001EDCB845|nr:hypothetical protein [Dactylosporangium sp. AC04546]WVK80643.1 hypothetical protein KZZ52_42800 [Dactylosporangium sp. AC04546]